MAESTGWTESTGRTESTGMAESTGRTESVGRTESGCGSFSLTQQASPPRPSLPFINYIRSERERDRVIPLLSPGI